MKTRPVHCCECPNCLAPQDHPDKKYHQDFNLLLSRSDEQHRRWLAAMEATRVGYGGIKLVALITGLDEKTISRGQAELDQSLQQRPTQRIRVVGGGRKLAEKKNLK